MYGNIEFQDRKKLWDNLLKFGSQSNDPWILIGDFNEILSDTEKFGARPGNTLHNSTFRSFFDNGGLIDLKYSRSHFTWANNREASALILERLDRTLVNTSFLHVFPSSYTHVPPAIGSDHCPLVFFFAPPLTRFKKPFKFEQKWMFEDDFNSVVSRGWTTSVHGSHAWKFG